MSGLQRKLRRKRMLTDTYIGPGMGEGGTPCARVILKMNPKTGKMQEYHLTKGWRP